MKFLASTTSALLLLLAMSPGMLRAQGSAVPEHPFSTITLYQLKNQNGLEVDVTNYGATITAIRTPDRHGKIADIALGFNTAEEYINAANKAYLGAIVGRYANRIAHGEFTLDGAKYQLAKNDNNTNHLHGGKFGFDKVVWNSEPFTEPGAMGIRLTYHSKDGEENYPGNLDVTVTYTLRDTNELVIDYRAVTDMATPLNLTNHTYFNLAGEGNGDILGQVLQLNAQEFTPVDSTTIPTGEIRAVANTPFDFTKPKAIGHDIEGTDQQLLVANGYDHNFILDPANKEGSLTRCAIVTDPGSGRSVEILTDQPAVQFYSGNYFDGSLKGPSGQPYVRHGGFALETQHYPDSPNHANFPNTILRPGENFQSRTIYRFKAEQG